MKYPKEYLDEIKIRLKVSQVVGKSVKLKKRGKEFIGLSPFSNEKTPSFTVNDEKGFYHCFSSAEHGNIFDFLMKTKNYKFGEAVRALAAEAGMPPYRFTKQDEEKQNRWNIYKSILEKYTNFCYEELVSGKYPEVLEYLKESLEEMKVPPMIHDQVGKRLFKVLDVPQMKDDIMMRCTDLVKLIHGARNTLMT